MKITSLIDNCTTEPGIETEHGMSLYIEMDDGRRLLFDMGSGEMFMRNAGRLGIDVGDVDVAVVSHGHNDHGGGLGTFLRCNSRARVHIREAAFEEHWSLKPDGLKSRALDERLRMSPRLIFCREAENIGPGMMTFVAGDCGFPQPPGDTLLFGPARGDGAGGPEQDDFAHEQSLLLMEGGNTVLIAGCAHRGAVNILRTAERLSGRKVTHFIGGLHLAQGVPAGPDYVRALAAALPADCRVWTMHCTGEDYFHTLKSIMGDRIGYLYCGRSVVIQSV